MKRYLVLLLLMTQGLFAEGLHDHTKRRLDSLDHNLVQVVDSERASQILESILVKSKGSYSESIVCRDDYKESRLFMIMLILKSVDKGTIVYVTEENSQPAIAIARTIQSKKNKTGASYYELIIQTDETYQEVLSADFTFESLRLGNVVKGKLTDPAVSKEYITTFTRDMDCR